MKKTIFEVNCQPKNDNFSIKNTVVYTNFHYECFSTLDAALSFCKEHIDQYLDMRIEEQLIDDEDEDAPHTVLKTHNPYELLGEVA